MKSKEYGDVVTKRKIALDLDCPKDILEELARDEYYNVRKAVASNPNCPKDILEELARDKYYTVRSSVAGNPNCPPELLTQLVNNSYNAIREAIASNLNCPIELFAQLANDSNYFIKRAILRNPKCPLYIVYYMIDNSIISKKELKDLDIELAFVEIILRKDCPKGFIFLFYDKVGFLSKIKKANIKIQQTILNNDREKCITDFFEETKKIFISKPYPQNSINLDFISKDIDFMYSKDNGNKTDFSSSLGNYQGSRVTFICDNRKYIEDKLNKYKTLTIAYGEYPQSKASELEKIILNCLYKSKMLNKTGKEYRILNNFGKTNYYKEYEVNGCKYVLKDDVWYKVEPIMWEYHKEKNMFICKNDLFTIVPVLTNKEKMLNVFFKNDSYVSEIKTDAEKVKKAQEEQLKEEERKRKEDIDRKIKENVVNKEDEELKKKKEKEEIEKEFLEILSKSKELNDRWCLLNGGIYSKINQTRITIDSNMLLVEVDGHIEIKEEFIPYLRYIDLSYIGMMDNLKVSGIDFRGSNISIDPQKVYNKDLSYSKFDDDNIRFKSFKGCNLIGSDISNEVDSIEVEEAIINVDTKLPVKKEKKQVI